MMRIAYEAKKNSMSPSSTTGMSPAMTPMSGSMTGDEGEEPPAMSLPPLANHHSPHITGMVGDPHTIVNGGGSQDLHGGMAIYNQNEMIQQYQFQQQQLYQQQLLEQQQLLQQHQQQQQGGGVGLNNGMLLMGGTPIGVYPGMPPMHVTATQEHQPDLQGQPQQQQELQAAIDHNDTRVKDESNGMGMIQSAPSAVESSVKTEGVVPSTEQLPLQPQLQSQLQVQSHASISDGQHQQNGL
jgi:hypothetical protein